MHPACRILTPHLLGLCPESPCPHICVRCAGLGYLYACWGCEGSCSRSNGGCFSLQSMGMGTPSTARTGSWPTPFPQARASRVMPTLTTMSSGHWELA